MPRNLSVPAVRALMAQVTDEAFIMLMTLWHDATGEVIRLALNTESIFSQGHEFFPCYFDITLPPSDDRAPQGCQVSIDNVDRRMVELLRMITTPVRCRLQLVLASQPSVIEMQLDDLVLREVEWDASRINGTLASEDPLNQMYPSHLYEPRTFQGIF